MAKGVKTPVTINDRNGSITIEIDGLDTVQRTLGELSGRTGQAMKVAINQSARDARKLLIAAAKARYAVTSRGKQRLEQLKQTKKATNTNLEAVLFSSQMRADLSYFKHTPTVAYSGHDVFTHSPNYYKAKVLLSSSMSDLRAGTREGGGKVSKGFLAKFSSGHIGMVQRLIGSSSSHTKTERGFPRWRNSEGKVEKLVTMGAPSGTAMERTVWPEVEDDVRIYLMARVQERVDWILEHYKG